MLNLKYKISILLVGLLLFSLPLLVFSKSATEEKAQELIEKEQSLVFELYDLEEVNLLENTFLYGVVGFWDKLSLFFTFSTEKKISFVQRRMNDNLSRAVAVSVDTDKVSIVERSLGDYIYYLQKLNSYLPLTLDNGEFLGRLHAFQENYFIFDYLEETVSSDLSSVLKENRRVALQNYAEIISYYSPDFESIASFTEIVPKQYENHEFIKYKSGKAISELLLFITNDKTKTGLQSLYYMLSDSWYKDMEGNRETDFNVFLEYLRNRKKAEMVSFGFFQVLRSLCEGDLCQIFEQAKDIERAKIYNYFQKDNSWYLPYVYNEIDLYFKEPSWKKYKTLRMMDAFVHPSIKSEVIKYKQAYKDYYLEKIEQSDDLLLLASEIYDGPNDIWDIILFHELKIGSGKELQNKIESLTEARLLDYFMNYSASNNEQKVKMLNRYSSGDIQALKSLIVLKDDFTEKYYYLINKSFENSLRFLESRIGNAEDVDVLRSIEKQIYSDKTIQEKVSKYIPGFGKKIEEKKMELDENVKKKLEEIKETDRLSMIELNRILKDKMRIEQMLEDSEVEKKDEDSGGEEIGGEGIDADVKAEDEIEDSLKAKKDMDI